MQKIVEGRNLLRPFFYYICVNPILGEKENP